MSEDRSDRFFGALENVAVTLPDGTTTGNAQAQRGPLTPQDFAEMLETIRLAAAQEKERGDLGEF